MLFLQQELSSPVKTNETSFNEIIVSVLPELEVIDGMLHFEDAEQFFATIDILLNAEENVVKEWENKIGFKSISSVQDEVSDLILECEEENHFYELLNIYSDIVKLEKGTVKYEFEDIQFAKIANNKKCFSIKDKAYKIIENYICETNLTNIELLQKISSVSDLNKNTNNEIIFYEYIVESIKDNKYYQTAVDFNLAQDRKLEFYAFTKKFLYNNEFYYQDIVAMTIAYKKNIWGNFVNYKTNIEFKFFRSVCSVQVKNNWGWLWVRIAPGIWEASGTNIKSLIFNYHLNDSYVGNGEPPNLHYFVDLYARTTTTGIPQYVYIDYQN